MKKKSQPANQPRSNTPNRKTPVSVALSYTFGEKAPIVVASGKGETAMRIREIAAKHDIKIVENPSLANVLVETEIGACIPEETYEAIAAIFAFLEKRRK